MLLHIESRIIINTALTHLAMLAYFQVRKEMLIFRLILMFRRIKRALLTQAKPWSTNTKPMQLNIGKYITFRGRECMNSSTFVLKNRNYISAPLQDIFFTRYAEIDLIAKPSLGYDSSVTMPLMRIITNLSWIWENASFPMKNYSSTARIPRKTMYFPT